MPEYKDNEGHDVKIKVLPLTALAFIKVNEKSLTIYPN